VTPEQFKVRLEQPDRPAYSVIRIRKQDQIGLLRFTIGFLVF
jgi:hypothetical protein